MTYTELTTYNLSGAEVLLIYVNDVTGGVFMTFFLLVLWVIFTFAPFSFQTRNGGKGDFAACMTVGCFCTAIIAIALRMITVPLTSLPLINPFHLIITIVGSIASLGWMLFEKQN